MTNTLKEKLKKYYKYKRKTSNINNEKIVLLFIYLSDNKYDIRFGNKNCSKLQSTFIIDKLDNFKTLLNSKQLNRLLKDKQLCLHLNNKQVKYYVLGKI